jgi:predicted nucleotidyltransferase
MFDIKPIIRSLEKDERILAAYLLGSAARGQMRLDSDIDIALMLLPGKTLSALEVMDLAASLTPRDGRVVDLGLITSQNLVYASEAILSGNRFLCRNEFQADLGAATFLGLAAQYRFERQEIINGYTH